MKIFLILAFILMFESCSSGDNTTVPVQFYSYEDLGECNSYSEGQSKFVVGEDRTYECVNGTWWWGTGNIYECNEENVGAERVAGNNMERCFRCCGLPPTATCPEPGSIAYQHYGSPIHYLWLTTTGSMEHYAECFGTHDVTYGLYSSNTSLSSSSAYSSPSSTSAYTSPVSNPSSSSVYSLPSSSMSIVYGSLVDSHDGQVYKTVVIGSQTWMAQNLNYVTSSSYCYDNEPSNCTKYGRLYTWIAAVSACPSGWHMPSKEEWEALFTAVDGQSMAGLMLKASIGWNDSSNGMDAYSFSALPAGYRDYYTGDFELAGDNTHFWSATQYDEDNAYCMELLSDDYRINLNGNRAELYEDNKGNGFSIRCLKD